MERLKPLNPAPPTGRAGGILVKLVVLLTVTMLSAGGIYYGLQLRGPEDLARSLITQAATRGAFDHIVLEQGEIESSRNTELVCQVRSRSGSSGGTSILWVADEGTAVKEGDKVVELDSSQLEQEQKQQRIVLANAEAAVASAHAAVEQAMIARQEYLEGVFLTDEKAIKSEIAIAEQEMRKSQLAMKSTQRLVAKGLVKSLQLEADQFAVANAKNQLDAAQARLRVLQELTRQRMLVEYDSQIAAARANLEAVRGTLEEERQKMTELEEQIAACVMHAPTDGVVVHANRYSSRGGTAEFVVEAGAVVRERQAIIRLPDPTQMQVRAKINENRVTLVKEGMPARIRVDALPGLELTGRVVRVNRYSEPGSFFSSSIKEYATIIEIIDPPDTIRTGMTAEARIFVEQLDDALQIPIQGVYEYKGFALSLLRTPDGSLETRQVRIGATNDKMATIVEGLDVNDSVVLNLRDHLDLVNLPEVKLEDNSDLVALRQQALPSADQVDTANGSDPMVQGMVDRIMERNDANSDGILSKEELASVDERFRASILRADVDGDGNVTRQELTKAAPQIMNTTRGAGGQSLGGGRPSGGGRSWGGN